MIDEELRPRSGRQEQHDHPSAAPVPPPFAGSTPPGGSERTPPVRDSSASGAPAGASTPAPRQGLLPDATWDWRLALLGLLVGFGPTIALSLLSLGSTGTSEDATTRITVASAIALIVSSAVMYAWQVAAAWFFSLRVTGEKLQAWGFRRPTAAYFWVIPLSLVVIYVITYVHDLLVHPEQQQILSQFPRTAAGVFLLTLLAVVMAPLFEELFFRGFLFRGLARSWGWPLAAVVSGAAFGAVHMQLSVFVPLFALGIALAWVYERTGSLWTSITLHAVFNGLSVIAWALTT